MKRGGTDPPLTQIFLSGFTPLQSALRNIARAFPAYSPLFHFIPQYLRVGWASTKALALS